MTLTDAEKEKVRTDVLAHYGVPGMKWGVRRNRDDSGPSRREQRRQASRDRDAEILNARSRQAKVEANFTKRQGNLDALAAKTYSTRYGSKEHFEANAKYERAVKKIEKDYEASLSSPDAVTAARLTRGEKIATGVMAGVGAAFVVGSIALSKYI